MKTIILILCFLIIGILFGQEKYKRYVSGNLLIKQEQLSDETQLNAIISVLMQYYGKSFKYFKELKLGQYFFERIKDNKNINYYLEILSPKDSSIQDKILL
jgi:hypothetical protein